MTIDDTSEISETVLMDSRATDRMASRAPQIRVITRAERRRIWSMEQKREIVAESLAGRMSVSAIARKHDISPGQLFTWRRQLLAGNLEAAAPAAPSFARVDVIATRRLTGSDQSDHLDRHAGGDEAAGTGDGGRTGVMDIVLADITVRVDASVDGVALRRVLAALGRR
jgi:transposase